ncbi:uncharacterized protein N7458_010691 [Penicillium daleae]|uniref:Uncharacterized protein n=1 Tax=Penicillium daleae TaxID=63821 RepID=A0AAD6FZA1_9EURO|nr:uncharacterized protein N7458_010691 [Penicillium daleae]KAJ5439693.1 hypothetical protein N7458_010691 [Penicillium daleae]
MWKIQQTIEQYRQYINYQVAAGKRMSLRPDLDDLFVANPASVNGVTDGQRITLMSFWLGASSSLLLGSDMTNVDDLGRQLLTTAILYNRVTQARGVENRASRPLSRT